MAFEDPLWIQSDGSAPVYSAREDRLLLSTLFNEGVIRGLKAKQRAAGAQMRVQLEDGDFAIQGDDSASPPQGMYLGRWTDDAVDANMFVIAAAPGSGSRRDLLFIRINDPTHGGPAGRNSTLGVVTGTPHATTPVLPALPTSAIPIAEVLVPTGKTSIVAADITDLRQPGGNKAELPIGTMVDYMGPEATIPTNYVVADGREINRLDYFGYMRKVGVVHGAGNGTTTVNVPDARGRVTIALDNMGGVDAARLSIANTLGASGGTETFTLIEANLPPHAHSIAHTHDMGNHTHVMTHAHGSTSDIFPTSSGPGPDIVTFQAGASRLVESTATRTIPTFTGSTAGPSTNTTGGVSTANTGNGGGVSTAISRLQPYILANKIIKVA